MEIPKEIISVISKLKKNGFETYLVGGCVRDFLQGIEPSDWDITTNAEPKEIQKVFPDSFYKNKFLTVTVKVMGDRYKIKGKKDSNALKPIEEVEITTFRTEAKYTDKRHPDEIKFAKTIEEDLARRDFTVNAMALQLTTNNKQQTTPKDKPTGQAKNLYPPSKKAEGMTKIIDLFNGQKDLKDKIIRAVGEPKQRFSEDALRLLRAVRFATTLNSPPKIGGEIPPLNLPLDKGEKTEGVWQIESKTLQSIKENAHLIQFISKERIRDELIKILESRGAYEGLLLLRKTGLLKYIVPELELGVGVTQNRQHIYTVFKHSLLSLKYAAEYNYNLNVRIAALLHDIAKPEVKQGEGPNSTFYNHDIAGARITIRILSRLKFPKNTVEKVKTLVRYHMFFYDPETVTESSVRRLLRRVGKENIEELIQVRICDRKGMGRPKAKPYRLRHFEYIISKVSKDPISVKMLKINGQDVMKILNIGSGPRVGLVLNALLSEVLDNPEKNKKEYLQKRGKEMRSFSDKELKGMEKKIEEKKMEVELEEKRKFYIH